MLTRRSALAAALALPASAAAKTASFSAYLGQLRAEARRLGITEATIRAALADQAPDSRVVKLDHHQPEFTLTWAQYRIKVLPEARLEKARAKAAENGDTLKLVATRTGVDWRICMGIWGLESGFGATTGSYNVVNALATLAWDGRREAFFRGELMNALRILDAGDVTAGRLTGSWAGAMGQPQFMPSAYLRFAIDFDGDGKRDIWGSIPDTLGSIGNYLGKSGWQLGVPWGQVVRLPPGLAPTGRDHTKTLAEWMEAGVRRADGRPFSRGDVRGAIVQPDGPGTEAFMVYENFRVIRRYNPSDFYALAVGLLGNAA